MDTLIRQLTELGIDRWVPFYAARSVPAPSQKGLGKRIDRWEKIAIEAVKQCRRGRLPQIRPAGNFNQLLEVSDAYDLKIMFWEDTPQAFSIPATVPHTPKQVLLVVGPEGGFEIDEVRQARAHGFLTTGLGPRILRAETATLAALTLVQYGFGDMGPAGRG